MGLVAAYGSSGVSVAADDTGETDRGQRQSREIAEENYTRIEKPAEEEAITVEYRARLRGGGYCHGLVEGKEREGRRGLETPVESLWECELGDDGASSHAMTRKNIENGKNETA